MAVEIDGLLMHHIRLKRGIYQVVAVGVVGVKAADQHWRLSQSAAPLALVRCGSRDFLGSAVGLCAVYTAERPQLPGG